MHFIIAILYLLLTISVFAVEPSAAGTAAGAKTNCVARELATIDIGFTLTHATVDTEAESACESKQGSGASIDGVNNIARNYDDPALRQRVRAFLVKMAVDGARVMRTNAWFRHAEDAPMATRQNDPLGLLVATNGKLPPKDVSNILNYVSDAQSAGYSRFFVVIGPQGSSNPKCRKGPEWGGCYDRAFLEKNWSVASQLIDALHTPQLAKIEVIVDLSPENCTDSRSKMAVYRYMDEYTRYMVNQYRKKYGDHKFVASCGGGKEALIMSTLAAQEQLFRDLGARPASVDVHIYETDESAVRRFLLAADASARRLGVPLDINETYYDHPNIFQTVTELRSTNQLPALRDLLVWPRRAKSSCQIDVPPPYAMDVFDGKLGRRTPDGKPLPACK